MHIGIVKISFFHQITILWKALMIIYVIIAHTNIYLTYEKEMYFENENIRLFADSDGFYQKEIHPPHFNPNEKLKNWNTIILI